MEMIDDSGKLNVDDKSADLRVEIVDKERILYLSDRSRHRFAE